MRQRRWIELLCASTSDRKKTGFSASQWWDWFKSVRFCISVSRWWNSTKAGDYWSQGCGKMQKGIGHNSKLHIINIAEKMFQGSRLRFLQNVWHCGCSVTDHWTLVASWGPELYSGDLEDFSTVHQPSLTLEAIGWIWEREGMTRKLPHCIFGGRRERLLWALPKLRAGQEYIFTCSVWSCRLVRESFARANLGFSICHVTSFLSGLQKRCRKASVAVVWQGIHICRYPCDQCA